MNTYEIILTESQKEELQVLVRTAKKAYLRERAKAILLLGQGIAGSKVCQQLLQSRSRNTIYAWRDAYKARGIEGLHIAPGRGRKPLFPPK